MTDTAELDALLALPEDDPRVIKAGGFWPNQAPVVDALEDLGPAPLALVLGLLAFTDTSPQSAVLAQAKADIGMGEVPANSNRNAIVTWYNDNVARIGVGPWCCMATTHWYWLGGAKSIVKGRAYVPWAIQDWLAGQAGGTFHWGAEGMRTGDQVFYDWSRSGVRSPWKGDHTGLCEVGYDGSTFTSIEGNYGDRCGRFKRDARYVLGYGRPNWAKVVAGTGGSSAPIPPTPAPKPAPAPKPTAGTLVVDGKLGPATIRRWQKVMGTQVDGSISRPSELVRAVQRRLNANGAHLAVDGRGIGSNGDGDFGPTLTVRALQRYLGTTADGVLSHPASSAVKALQARLNEGKF